MAGHGAHTFLVNCTAPVRIPLTTSTCKSQDGRHVHCQIILAVIASLLLSFGLARSARSPAIKSDCDRIDMESLQRPAACAFLFLAFVQLSAACGNPLGTQTYNLGEGRTQLGSEQCLQHSKHAYGHQYSAQHYIYAHIATFLTYLNQTRDLCLC